jgi:hypothetical protein
MGDLPRMFGIRWPVRSSGKARSGALRREMRLTLASNEVSFKHGQADDQAGVRKDFELQVHSKTVFASWNRGAAYAAGHWTNGFGPIVEREDEHRESPEGARYRAAGIRACGSGVYAGRYPRTRRLCQRAAPAGWGSCSCRGFLGIEVKVERRRRIARPRLRSRAGSRPPSLRAQTLRARRPGSVPACVR